MVYKSIFDRLKNYKSNPIDEYNKLYSYFDNLTLNFVNFSHYLESAYYYCNEFRAVYPELGDLLESSCRTISRYGSPVNNYDSDFSENQKEQFLNEYLTYCQIILTLIFIFRDNKEIITHYNSYIDQDNRVTDYCLELISTSLKSFCYKFVKGDKGSSVEIISDNPIAESVAAISSSLVSDPIYSYLSTKNMKEKETSLRDLINAIEPLLIKYSDQPLVKKVREYVQLLRHPEVIKAKKEYAWFFANKKKHIDDLFAMCVFVQQYELTKNIVGKFEKNKQN